MEPKACPLFHKDMIGDRRRAQGRRTGLGDTRAAQGMVSLVGHEDRVLSEAQASLVGHDKESLIEAQDGKV